MNYVLTDLHGEYDLFLDMLEKIEFSDEDTLYILGDCCDRGPQSAEIYLDLMNRKNIRIIRGNHEEMALKGLGYIIRTGTFPGRYCEDFQIQLWFENGGTETINSLHRTCMAEGSEDEIDMKKLEAIYKYICDMPYYLTAKVGKREFVMVHAGLGNFREDKPLEEYTVRELVWERPNFNTKLFADEHKYLLVGHTPTFTLVASPKASIYRGKGDIMALDCGATYYAYGGRLACLCLDTMEVVYVSK